MYDNFQAQQAPTVSKARVGIFMAAAGFLQFLSTTAVSVFMDLQVMTVGTIGEKDPGFSLFFIRDCNPLLWVVLTVILVCIVGVMLIASLVVALLTRISLRKAWSVSKKEFNICAVFLGACAVIGTVASLIITHLGCFVSVLLLQLIPVIFLTLMYLLPLDRRCNMGAHGHFVQGTQQDLTQL